MYGYSEEGRIIKVSGWSHWRRSRILIISWLNSSIYVFLQEPRHTRRYDFNFCKYVASIRYFIHILLHSQGVIEPHTFVDFWWFIQFLRSCTQFQVRPTTVVLRAFNITIALTNRYSKCKIWFFSPSEILVKKSRENVGEKKWVLYPKSLP